MFHSESLKATKHRKTIPQDLTPAQTLDWLSSQRLREKNSGHGRLGQMGEDQATKDS